MKERWILLLGHLQGNGKKDADMSADLRVRVAPSP